MKKQELRFVNWTSRGVLLGMKVKATTMPISFRAISILIVVALVGAGAQAETHGQRPLIGWN
jgi:hypothetical protein